MPVFAQALVEQADLGLIEKFPKLTQTGVQLVDSGIFEERTVGILASAGKTLADSYGDTIDKPHKAVGLGGLLKALGDPDIQRSLGLLLDFAKRFGQKINA